jgi:predicted Abi (CAAX) family protease
MKKIKEQLFLGFVKLVFAWTVFALSFQVTMITLSYTKPELATKIGNEITWKLDGRFNK